MSYRKITVDGKEYEYTVGRTHVKVKGVGVWLKEEVGEKLARICACGCGEPMDILYSEEKLSEYDYRYTVHPSNVAEKISKVV